MADTTNSTDKKGTYHQIRDQYFYIEISMYNQIDKQKPLYVPFFFVDSIKIHEGLHNWITKAEIVFNADFEIFARGAQKISSDPNNTEVKAPYIDRTDGRNRMHVTIYPVDVTSNGNVISENADNPTKFPKKYWEMDLDFVVVDIQDLPTPNVQIKKRMYMLIDERYQILKEKNLEWSSATISAKKLNKQAQFLKDSEAAINPNDALKELLTLISTNGDTMEKIKIGFDKTGTIDKPNIDFDKTQEKLWDAGDASNKVLFYPTANSTALDDLFYVLSHCKSSDGYPVLLDYGRSSEDKGWHLISLSEYFKNASQEQVERIVLEDGLAPDDSASTDDTSSSTPYVPRADDSAGTQTKNFTSVVASKISKYSYSPMVSLDDARIINSPLCYYDEHTGFFNLKKKDNTAKNVIEKLKSLAQLGLYNFKKSTQKPQILINLNKTKTTGQMTKNEFAINGPYCLQVAPLNQMILDAIFLNQSVSFQALGLTLRTPGKFLFIDRVASGESNPFDDRFLGQWMMISVTHLFTQETYVTEVVANKIDSFSQLWPEEDNNY